MKIKLFQIFILLLIFKGDSFSQKTYLELAIEGDNEEKEFVNSNNIEEIKIVSYKSGKRKLKRLKTKLEKRFDANGNLIFRKEYLRKRGRLWTYEIRTYDEENYLTTIKHVSNFSKDFTTDRKLNYNETKTQVWIETEQGQRNYKWNSSTSKLLNERKQIYAQIRKGRDTLFFHYDNEGKFLATSKSKNNFNQEFKYDSKGNLIESNLFNEVRRFYEIDLNGNCIKSEQWLEVEGNYELVSSRKMKYEKNNLIELIIFDSDNQAKERVEYFYEDELLRKKKYYNSKNILMTVDKYEYRFRKK